MKHICFFFNFGHNKVVIPISIGELLDKMEAHIYVSQSMEF